MKNTWYKTETYSLEITPVNVLKETPKTLDVLTKRGERMVQKVSQYEIYFSSKEEAKKHLINRYEVSILYYSEKIDQAKKWLEEVSKQ